MLVKHVWYYSRLLFNEIINDRAISTGQPQVNGAIRYCLLDKLNEIHQNFLVFYFMLGGPILEGGGKARTPIG